MSSINGVQGGVREQEIDEAPAAPSGAEGATSGPVHTLSEKLVAKGADLFERFKKPEGAREADCLGQVLGGLRSDLKKSSKLLSAAEKTQLVPGMEGLDTVARSAGVIGSALAKVASKVGDAETALRLPKATKDLNDSFDAYQRKPSEATAAAFKNSLEAWQQLVAPLAEKIPGPAGQELKALLEIGSKAIAFGSTVFTGEKTTAEGMTVQDRPTAPVPQLRDPREGLWSTTIDAGTINNCKTIGEVGAYVDVSIAEWAERNHLRSIPSTVVGARDAVQDVHRRLEENAAAAAGNWNPLRRGPLAEERQALRSELFTALVHLEHAAQATSPVMPLGVQKARDLASVIEGKK